jgi:hypothetical protein
VDDRLFLIGKTLNGSLFAVVFKYTIKLFAISTEAMGHMYVYTSISIFDITACKK